MRKKRCIDDDYLTKKSLMGDLKLIIYFGTILVGIALSWGDGKQADALNAQQQLVIIRDMNILNSKIDGFEKSQMAMQKQTDKVEERLNLHLGYNSDQSANFR